MTLIIKYNSFFEEFIKIRVSRQTAQRSRAIPSRGYGSLDCSKGNHTPSEPLTLPAEMKWRYVYIPKRNVGILVSLSTKTVK